jgi:hypothetical protein
MRQPAALTGRHERASSLGVDGALAISRSCRNVYTWQQAIRCTGLFRNINAQVRPTNITVSAISTPCTGNTATCVALPVAESTHVSEHVAGVLQTCAIWPAQRFDLAALYRKSFRTLRDRPLLRYRAFAGQQFGLQCYITSAPISAQNCTAASRARFAGCLASEDGLVR